MEGLYKIRLDWIGHKQRKNKLGMTRMVVVGTLGCKHNIKLDRTKTKVKKEHRKKSENKVSVRGHA